MAKNNDEVGKIAVGVELDTIEAFKNVSDFNNQIKLIRSGVKSAGDGTKAFGKSLEGLQVKNKGLNQELEVQQEKLKVLKKQYDDAINAEVKNEKQIMKLTTQYQNTQSAINRVTAELKQNSVQIAEQSSEWKKAEQSASIAIVGIDGKIKTLNSAYRAAVAGVDDLGNSEDGLRKKSEYLNQTLKLQNQGVDELKRAFDLIKGAKGEDAQETQKAAQKYYDAIASMKKTEKAIKDVDQALEKQGQEWKETVEELHDAESAFDNLNGKMSDIGGKMAVGLTAPIAGAGLAMAKVAMDADTAGASIQASLGLSEKEASKLKETATKVWSEGFGENMDEVQGALVQVKQNIHGLNDGDLEQVTKDSMTLAKVFNADVNEVTRAGGNLMKGFGLSSKEAYDLMAHGAQNGLNFSNEMFDNLSEYGPLFSKMGFSADEYFQLLEQGSKAGVYNLDYINDAMKEFQIRAKDGSKATSDAFGQMTQSTQNLWKEYEAGKISVKDLHNAVIGELKGMDDQTKANQIGVGLYGTKWEDLEADAMYALGGIDGGLKNVDGSMKRSSDAIQQSFGVRAKSAIRELGQAFLPLGNELLDLAEKYLPSVENAIAKVTEFIHNMSPEAKTATLAFAGIVAVLGPLAMAVGGVMTTMGPLVGVLGTIIPALGGATAGAGLLTAGLAGGGGLMAGAMALIGPVGLAVGAIAAIGVTAYSIDKALDKPILKSKIFSDEISKSTQKAVGAYLKLDKDATVALNQLSWSQQNVTKAMADKLIGQYHEMSTKILASIDKRNADQMSKAKKLFADNDALSTAEEGKILKKIEQGNAQKKAKIKQYEADIKKIIQTANKEKRDLSEKDRQDIGKIQEKMRKEAVTTMSKSKAEQMKILGALKNESSKLTAEQASKVVQNSKKQRDGSVKEAQTQYKKSVEQIRYMRDVSKTITADQAEQLIKNAKKQRDGSVKHAEDMHKKVVKEAKNQAKGHADEIDWETGKVKTGWDKMEERVDKAVRALKSFFGVKGGTKASSSKKKSGGGGGGGGATNKATNKYTGTPNGQHMGGPAIMGEEGIELVHTPQSGVGIVGLNGPEYVPNLPKGSSVLPTRHTERVLSQYGFGNIPMYASGVGDFFDGVMKGPSALWDMATAKVGGLSDSLLPDWFTNTAGSAVGYIKDLSTNWLKGLIDDWGFGFGGSAPNIKGGAKAWKPMILKAAMAMKTQVTEAQVQGIIAQIQRESGGNQKIVQSSAVRDINTRNGNPARGLLQYIPQTFRAYAVKGHSNIYSGYDQLLAFFNNSTWARDLPYGRRGWGPRGKRRFANGGLVNQHQIAEIGEEGQEMIIPLVAKRRERGLQLWLEAGKMLGAIGMNPDGTQTTSAGGNTTVTSNSNDTYELHFHFPEQAVNSPNGQMDYRKIALGVQAELEKLNKLKNRYEGVVIR